MPSSCRAMGLAGIGQKIDMATWTGAGIYPRQTHTRQNGPLTHSSNCFANLPDSYWLYMVGKQT